MEDDDAGSTATMTSVTEDLSVDETDTSTQDIDTSSQITSSDAVDEGNAPPPAARCAVTQQEADTPEVSMEAGSEVEDMITTSTDDDNPVPDAPVAGHARRAKPASSGGQRPWGSGAAPLPDASARPGEWYQHRCFDHYWRHYHYVSLWCRKHLDSYRTVMQQYHTALRSRQPPGAHPSTATSQADQHTFKKPFAKKTFRNRKARRRRKAAKKRQRTEQKNANSRETSASCSSLMQSSDNDQKAAGQGGGGGGGETTESALEVADMNTDVEITEELLDFFAHTHKHKQERDALKKSKENGKEEKHVSIEEGGDKERTDTAPVERPGSKRTSEMLFLYGKGAAMIHGMETALQMTFDRNTDVLQPKMWPNMPLRIIF